MTSFIDSVLPIHQFGFREKLDLAYIKAELCLIFNIDNSKLIDSSVGRIDERPDVIFYEYYTTEKGFKSYLTLYLENANWKKLHYKNAILDFAIIFAKHFKQEIVIALDIDDPNDFSADDWALIKPDGTVYRVWDQHPDKNYFVPVSGSLTLLSDDELVRLKQPYE